MVSVDEVPIPTIIPESPEYVLLIIVSVNNVGDSIRTTGGWVDV